MEYWSVGVLREGRIAPRSGLGMPKGRPTSVLPLHSRLYPILFPVPRHPDISKIRSPFQGEAFGWKLPRAEALGYVV
jgi:hypothetical protein